MRFSRNLSSIFVPTDLSAISPFVVQPRTKTATEKSAMGFIFSLIFLKRGLLEKIFGGVGTEQELPTTP